MRTLILAAVMLFPVVSLSQPKGTPALGVVAVADPPGPNADLADLTNALRGEISERARGVLAADQLRQRMLGTSGAGSLAELDRAYSGAIAAYQAGDYEGASRSLRAVIDDLERLPESDQVFSQWSRAMLRLARAEGSLGRKGESNEVMGRLLRANPTITADPELYPPSFARQLDEMRAEIKKGPQRKLTVNGPKGARVFVEGRDVGAAPAALTLAAGKYRVSGAVGDARVTMGVTDLTHEDQVVDLDMTLAEMFRPSNGPGLAIRTVVKDPLARDRAIVSAGGRMKLDQLITAAMVSDGDVRYLVGTVYEVRTGKKTREGRVRLVGATPPQGGLDGLATFLMTGEASSLVSEVKAPPDVPPAVAAATTTPKVTEPAKGGLYEKPNIYGWSSLGTGVLTLGLGGFATYEGIMANSYYSQARDMTINGVLRPDADYVTYNNLLKSGHEARNLALITGGGAAVALIGTGVLGYLAYQQNGTIGPFRF